MRLPRWAQRWGFALSAAGLGCVALAVFASRHWGSLYDDAYIYFRYADNLAAGCGPRFNCDGARVEGFSSPLYLAMLALVRLGSADLEAAAQWLGTASLAASIVLVALSAETIMRKQSRARAWPAVVLTVLALAVNDGFMQHALAGLETALAALACSGLLYSLMHGRRYLRTWLVLVVLARSEGILFVCCFALLPEARSWRRVAPLAAILVALAAARLALFGALLPNTYTAKSGWTLLHARFGVAYVVESFAQYPAVLLAPLALALRRISREVTFVLAASTLWILGTVPFGGDFFAHGRLLVPLVPALTALGTCGLLTLLARVRFRPKLLATTAALGAAMGLLVHGHARALAPRHGFARVQHWRAIGRYLRAHHPTARVATVPVGALAYEFRGHVLDLLGLTDKTIAHSAARIPAGAMRRDWIGHERHARDYVLAAQPDLIVFMEWRGVPWSVEDAQGGVYAEIELLDAIMSGLAPYRVVDLEIAPGVHPLVFERVASPRP